MTVHHIMRRDDRYIIVTDRNNGWRERRISLTMDDLNVEGSVEWAVLSKHNFGVGIVFGQNGSESDIGLDIFLGPLAAVFMRLGAPWLKPFRIEGSYEPRHTGIRIMPFGGCIASVEVFNTAHSWSRDQPWWYEQKLMVSHLLGNWSHSEEHVDSGTTRIPLPEGNYIGVWTATKYTSRRTKPLGKLLDAIRGPQTWVGYNLAVEGGVPVQGKGENSWDCGMDGVWEMSVGGGEAPTLSRAVGHFVQAVLRDRERHGGPHALPRPMTVAEAEKYLASGVE